MDRAYRDARINRIFEGTNEINRFLIVDMMLRRAAKGELDLLNPAQKVAAEIMRIPSPEPIEQTLFAREKSYIGNFKKAALLVAGAAVQKLMQTLAKEQEVLMAISDIIIEIYVCESLQLRVEKLVGMRGEEACKEHLEIMRVYINDAADKIHKYGKEAINSFATGDEQKIILTGLRRFTKVDAINTTAARRNIAAKLITENKYCF